jgi:hypothetical protein
MSHHEPRLKGEKVCTKCDKSKPVICFAVQKDSKDGLRNECRDCIQDYASASRKRKVQKSIFVKPPKKFRFLQKANGEPRE